VGSENIKMNGIEKIENILLYSVSMQNKPTDPHITLPTHTTLGMNFGKEENKMTRTFGTRKLFS
jgi:hypothetical protein